jgi:hypothetical protein
MLSWQQRVAVGRSITGILTGSVKPMVKMTSVNNMWLLALTGNACQGGVWVMPLHHCSHC